MTLSRRSMAGALLASALGTGAPDAQDLSSRNGGFAPANPAGRADAPEGFRPGSGRGLRLRKNLATLPANDPDLQALIYAVGQMRADPGPLGWQTQRRVHAAPWGHHNSWRFLPWHRFQLHYLERIIARVSGKPDFAMPYWNWDDDHAPYQYFQRSSPLYDNTRTITANTRISSYLGFEWSQGADPGDFWGRTDNEFGDFFGNQNPTGEPGAGYAGSAEQYGHNLIHLFCGGRMRNLLESPLDPLFWAHHSNVDRQWAIWTDIHGDHDYPREWGSEPCTGYVDEEGYLAPARTAGECADTRMLGFTYDDLRLAERARRHEQWPGQADPTPQRVVEQTLQMQRQSSNLGRIFVPPQLVSNLKGANGPEIDAAGFMQVFGMDGYVVRISSRSSDGSYEFGQDALFSVPMGGGDNMGMGMHPMGHRLQLKRLIPRDPRALSEGFWIEADAEPLRGEAGHSKPELTSFVLNYRAAVF